MHLPLPTEQYCVIKSDTITCESSSSIQILNKWGNPQFVEVQTKMENRVHINFLAKTEYINFSPALCATFFCEITKFAGAPLR